MILAVVMVLSLLPATAFATGSQEDVIYLSVSFDGEYAEDKTGQYVVYRPISFSDIEAINLSDYGLEHLRYDPDGDGDYETTALQLMIYAHEEIYGGDWLTDVTFEADAGSTYLKDGFFGFTENLVYFLNGDFPLQENQNTPGMLVGATSDQIVLEPGDCLDIASFTCYSFLWDYAGGFHHFSDAEDRYLFNYTVEAGEALNIRLMQSFCDLMYGQATLNAATDYTVYYGETAFGSDAAEVVTDGDGYAEVTFDEPGTYYLWCYGSNGADEMTHISCDYYGETGTPCIVSAPAFAKVTVTGAADPEAPRQPQDISAVLNATLAMQAETVKEPSFGTNYGEWTVFGLARGGYYANDSQYFADYYDRIVEYVNEKAAEINMSGALDKSKSTDNSRLIMALASIGKDATSVGNWDLVEAYSANGINWIRKQGMNGTIWTLIALDCGGYETSDPTIRQQCVDAIVSAQHNDGGWSLVTAKAQPSNVDITGMTLTALYPYRNQPAVAEACEEAFTWLSESQLDNGGFPYGKGETSESCVWAIVACTTWGINPDTDPRFIKNGYSAIDNLLTYYLEDEAKFEHGRGAGANAMATDQATYGLIAYDRLVKGKPSLYDYSDVTVEEDTVVQGKPTATLGLPAQITDDVGKTFNAVITLDQWDNAAGYKLIDLIVNVPEGLSVTGVNAGSRLNGGEVSYHLDEEGKLRIVYFDANEHSDITVVGNAEGNAFPAQFFTITFQVDAANAGEQKAISIGGMSIKKTSDSSDENAMVVVNTTTAAGNITVVKGISYSTVCLYTGDDIDLIPATKKAVAVSVVGIENATKLTYNDGTNQYVFKYSAEISAKTGVATYVALVDASIDMTQFVSKTNFTFTQDAAAEITFGDTNGDGVINAQDALNAVDAWLRKGDAPTDDQILTMNVNGDSRINTFDALGIVEAFVNKSEYLVITKAATLTTNP